MKKAMISQPMRGLSEEQIQETRKSAIKHLEDMGYVVVNSYFHGDNIPAVPENCVNKPLFYLAKSLQLMSDCEMLYCCQGWENARGCVIEHKVAQDYGLAIIYDMGVI